MSPEAQDVSQNALHAPRAAADTYPGSCNPPLHRLLDEATLNGRPLYTNELEFEQDEGTERS